MMFEVWTMQEIGKTYYKNNQLAKHWLESASLKSDQYLQ